jgi:hypothetical protein
VKPKDNECGLPVPQLEGQVWDQFRNDHELLERLRVTPPELDALAHCVLLGTLTCKQDMLFILRQIRAASEPASEVTKTPPFVRAPRKDDANEYLAKDAAALANYRRAASVRKIVEPASPAGIARSRMIEQFGVLLWAVVLIGFLMWNFVGGMSSWRQHFTAGVGIHAQDSSAPDAQSDSNPEHR